MKATISLTTLFKAMIAFILLFAAFLTLSITYNRAFRLKNEVLSIIEKYEGVTRKSLNLVNNYLTNSRYNTKSSCRMGDYGATSLTELKLVQVTNEKDKNYYYCLTESVDSKNKKINYRIRVFFKFNLPILGELMTFSISGETKEIRYYSNEQRLQRY